MLATNHSLAEFLQFCLQVITGVKRLLLNLFL